MDENTARRLYRMLSIIGLIFMMLIFWKLTG